MKYFLIIVILVSAIIAGGFYVDYNAILTKVTQNIGEDKTEDQQQKMKENNRIAYSLLEAISQVKNSLVDYTKEPIRYIVKDTEDQLSAKRHLFTKSDYETVMVNGNKQILLKVDALRSFYYKIDNLLVRDLPLKMQDSVHEKLKERYQALEKKLLNLREEIDQQNQRQKVLDERAAELQKEKQRIAQLIEKKNREQNQKDALLKEKELSLEKQKKDLQKKETELRIKKKQEEKAKKELEKKNIEKRKNKIMHHLIPLGSDHYWTYRVAKYIDKTIAHITFSSRKRKDIWIWEDDKGNVKNISRKNGFIFMGRKKWLPYSLQNKKWTQGNYDVFISHDGELVATDAGTFRCVVVVAKSQDNNSNIIKEYYSPYIGQIKQERFLNGKKTYEKTLIDYRTAKRKNILKRMEEIPKNTKFFPIKKKTSWEYYALKLLENTISYVNIHYKKEKGKWILEDSTNYSPTLAISEGFVMVGLEKMVPVTAEKSQAWTRGKFQVHVSHFGEIVNTGMGNFKCLLVVCVHTEKPDYVVKEYYAPGVGQVKKEIFSKSKKIYERILKRYH